MIGLFDSGVGGLSVLRALVQNGVKNDFIYFGDTKNVPYGTKTKEEILSYTREIMQFFVKKGVDIAVMACNTSSALVYEELKEEFSNRIKILPLIQQAAPYFKDETGTIGVMATSATVKSLAYTREITKVNKNINVVELECQRFVEIVEKRLYEDISAIEYVKQRAEYLQNAGCKKVILGCTHFPYLVPVFRRFTPGVEFIDPAKYLVGAVKDMLEDTIEASCGYKKTSTFEFYVSSDVENFKKSGSIFFDIENDVKLVEFAKC